MLSSTRHFLGIVVCFILSSLSLFFFFGQQVFATDLGITLASSVVIEGDVQDGDIISYNPETQSYYVTQKISDKNIFGVMVSNPVLYMSDSTASGTQSIVRFGETMVNVSDWSGQIKAGDIITTSHIVGAGQRMMSDESGYVVGFALTDAEYQSETQQVEGKDVHVGRVLTSLSIGYLEGDEDREELILSEETEEEQPAEEKESKIFRYLIGSTVIIIAMILVLRRFADLFSQSVVSVGRNPLAHSKIRSILIWNAMLVVIIGAIGVGIGIALIII